MKKHVRSTVSYLLAVATLIAMLALPQSAAVSAPSAPNRQEKKWQVKKGAVKTGPEVASRVRKLREENRSVRAALRAFERKGRNPKVENAVAIYGEFSTPEVAVNRKGNVLFRKASLTYQDQTAVAGNGYELILIPSIETYEEWQGTAISTMYDEYGGVIERYSCNIVSVAGSDGNPVIKYEIVYADDGMTYLKHDGPEMYTGYALGTLGRDHQPLYGEPPPTYYESWQFSSPQDQEQYYYTYPAERDRTIERESPILEQQISRWDGATFKQARPRGAVTFMRASFAPPTFQTRSDRAIERWQRAPGGPLYCGRPYEAGCGPDLQLHPYVRSYFVKVAFGCGAMAFCGGDVRCRAVACGGAAIANLPTLFGY